MICIASSTGVMKRWNVSLRPASTPSGIPIARDTSTEAVISDSVSMLSSQSPIRPKEANVASTSRATRQPPNRHVTSVPASVTPIQVSQPSKSVSEVTSQSRKSENGVKT